MTSETYHTILVRKYVSGMASEDEQQEIYRWLDLDVVNWSSFLAIAIVTALNECVTVEDVEKNMHLSEGSSVVRVDQIKRKLHNLLGFIQSRREK